MFLVMIRHVRRGVIGGSNTPPPLDHNVCFCFVFARCWQRGGSSMRIPLPRHWETDPFATFFEEEKKV